MDSSTCSKVSVFLVLPLINVIHHTFGEEKETHLQEAFAHVFFLSFMLPFLAHSVGEGKMGGFVWELTKGLISGLPLIG
jgi:hypothetical protein